MKLTPEQQALWRDWIAALRSDLYEQGRGRLRRPDGRLCCLGVLADLYDSSKWEKPQEVGVGWQYGGHNVNYLGSNKRGCGLDRELETQLANLNDDGKSFQVIANVVERELARRS